MKKSILLVAIFICMSISHIAKPTDPKIIALCVTGSSAALLGLYTTHKGLHLAFGENPQKTSLLKSGIRRLGGVVISATGLSLAGLGLAGILASDFIIDEINHQRRMATLERWFGR